MVKLLVFIFSMSFILNAQASEVQHYTLNIQNHRFEPEILELPSNTRIKLNIINHDKTPEEFESIDLKREKIILGNSKTTVSFGPLSPGEYIFFGDFHQDTAQGKIIIK
ncbi:cupredoxin domain-containing protein [Rickettsiales endosymbiont of Stachyamoeba lipophora]|uniref:cupredoxin domain-containing protein n=1 Tax=Rickettsiales endosymbiont of Stachyamoeba lipophora TaxID=2486578 RepID=UPI000F64ECC0|nr:cupredoxin domain-containing protein [Rickettsiales endosymbiont of Stachyamoeba lipophora]AZL15639.1 cupredoxin domain-containing protein [Rickettsiales endosymbiont of Stachyamoeba lipophora]